MANIQQVSFTAPADYSLEQQKIDRQRKMAEALQQQSLQPMDQGQMVSGIYVQPSVTQGLAKLLQAYQGRKGIEEADKGQSDLTQRSNKALADGLSNYQKTMQGTPAQEFPIMDDEYGAQTATAPAVAGNKQQALAALLQSGHPTLQQFGMQQMLAGPEKPVVVGRSLLDPNTGKVVGVDTTWKEEQQAAREARAADLQAKLEDQRASRQERADAQRELLQMRMDGQREMRQMVSTLRPEPAPAQATIADPSDPSKTIIIDARTNRKIGDAPVKDAVNATQKITDAKDVLSLLDQATPLINTATNSYLGAGVDAAARTVGVSTKGAQSAAELKALEGALVSKMPRMSGPQSDKDVLLYRQMAGQIGDPTVPRETKLAAIRTIREINERQAGIPKAPALPGQSAIQAELKRRGLAK